jgi:hypothetical protein
MHYRGIYKQDAYKLISEASDRGNEGQPLSPAQRTILRGVLRHWHMQTSGAPVAQPLLTIANPSAHERDNKKIDMAMAAGPVTAVPVPDPGPDQAHRWYQQPHEHASQISAVAPQAPHPIKVTLKFNRSQHAVQPTAQEAWHQDIVSGQQAVRVLGHDVRAHSSIQPGAQPRRRQSPQVQVYYQAVQSV